MLHIKSIEIMGVQFFDLQPDHCRWPTGRGFSCGEPRRDEGTSYCEAHHRVAYPQPGGGRAFSVGGFMRFRAEKVEAAREGIARSLQPPEKHSPIPLDQFVRAAAAQRHGGPPPPAPVVIKEPEVARIVRVRRPYVAPPMPETVAHTIEEWYLASLARQCRIVCAEIEAQKDRGMIYAVAMRNRIAFELGMSVDALCAPRKNQELVTARQFAMYCCERGAVKASLPAIGQRVFGGFDHTTVLHACRKIERMIVAGALPNHLAAILEKIRCTDPEIDAAVRKAHARAASQGQGA